jgi:GTP pyrophosphokinase
VKRLPKGATAIDFAFHVHTEVGVHCQGAKINGRIAPLHRELKNGDAIEILTSPSAKPSRDWLSHVRTGRARHKIKQWVRHEEETVSSQLGREILQREMKRRRLAMPDAATLNKAAHLVNMEDGMALEAAVGRGDLALGQVVRALHPEASQEELVEPKPTVFGRMLNRIRLGRGIKIQGVDGLLVRYAQCCQPVPGDSVVGYVTQGRGISIHRADCPNLLTLSAGDRRVEIDWQEQEGESFAVRLVVNAEDRRGLYADILQAISATGTNIRGADLHTKDGGAFGTVFVEVDNLPHLAKVLKAVRRVKGVASVDRREAPATT